MELPQSLGHLTNVDVEGLFGVRSASFKLDSKEPTLLTGSNGSGKSTILKMLSAIGKGEWIRLGTLPFDKIKLKFESGVRFAVTKVDNTHIRATLNGRHFAINLEEPIEFDQWPDEILNEIIPDVVPITTGMYSFRGRIIDREELSQLAKKRGIGPFNRTESPELIEFVNRFHVLFITDQRLVVPDHELPIRRPSPRRERANSAAEASADELARQMRQALNEYARESQRLDRDFPQRVVLAMSGTSEVPVGRLEALIADIEAERRALQAVGLLPHDLSPDAFRDLPLTDAKIRPVIETFAEDTQRKFAVLANLRERLTIFTEFLNQHFEGKRVTTNTEQGFDVEVSTIDSPQRLRVSQLSSGEQQILVLAFEILFSAESDTLILIDEPELSLHVLWQDTFVQDLTLMGRVRNLQFILATHSPTLIGGRNDLKRSLDSRR